VTETQPEGFIISSPGSKALPLRHSLKEHQDVWMAAIRSALEGKLEPSPEDKAKLNMAMKNMTTNATEDRQRSDTQSAGAKTVTIVKGWGRLAMTVEDSERGAGVIVTALGGDSKLAACGLNVGDTVIAVNKVLVKNHASTIAAIDACGAADELQISTAIATHKKRLDKTKGDVGVSLANMPSGVGVSVCGLADNSAAEEAGIEINDEILAINGTLVNSHTDAVKAINEASRWVDFVLVGADVSTLAKVIMVEASDFGSLMTVESRAPEPGAKVVTASAEVEAAGIKPGSVVISINNCPVCDDASCKAALEVSSAGRAHIFVPLS